MIYRLIEYFSTSIKFKANHIYIFLSYLTNRKILSRIINPFEIPIIINSFNRLSCLRELVEKLSTAGYSNIVIIDNGSTYQPLLDWYSSIPFEIIYLGKNMGHMALWNSGLINRFNKNFFVYSDPDVIPVENCPTDFLRHFINIMLRFPYYAKVGFSLKIDDLPDHYKLKSSVLEVEKKFWESPLKKDLFRANIDTTFALYAPRYYRTCYENGFYDALRTGGVYQARHLPWYSNTDHPSDEEIYYNASANKSASWTTIIKGL